MKCKWEECTIGDCCTISKKIIQPKAGIQYTCFSLPAFDNGKHPEIIDGKAIKSAKFLLTANTILFNKLNPKFRRVWNIHSLNETNITVCSTEYLPLKVKNTINQDFLYYYISSPYFTNLMDGIKTGTSNSQQRIDWKLFLKEPILLPSLDIQERVISILRNIDDKIELNNAINNNLEQQAQAIFKSWFVDFEPFDGQIPDVWKSGVLGDFVEIKRGGSPRPIQNYLSDSGLHWLKISDATSISSPFINEIKEYIIDEGLKKTVFLKAGNLVLSNSATPGLPKILDIDTCIHDGWLYFPSSKLSNEYLYLYFKYIRNNLVALGNGSVFTNLKTDILKNYPTNLPSADVLNEFDGIIKPIFSMILSNTRETKRLIEIRDTLLPKLMSGELDVSDIKL